MLQLLTLSRAARLAGVTRSALQARIRAGELLTFEGKVSVTDLLRLYPAVAMDTNPMLERVEEIKSQATYKRREDEPCLPAPDVLLQRLQRVALILVNTKAQLNHATEVLSELRERLKGLANGPEAGLRSSLAELTAWLMDELEKHPVTPDGQARFFAKDTFLRIIAAMVKVIPSGHEFFVDGHDSILEAAIRAGLHLNYGCTNGNCGSCKARVVSGQVWKLRDHDYVLSDYEKGLGYVLMCSNTAVTDLVIEAAEATSSGDLPLQQIRATVQRLERLSENLMVLHVQTPRTQTLRFMAGQQATLTVEDEYSATLPIASCPCDGRHLQFHVRGMPGERFSAVVFEKLRASQRITVTGPEGKFVLQEDSSKPAMFIAFDDGFAPIKSLVEHAIAIDTAESIHLYWIVSRRDGHYLDNLCRSWRDALENFRYTPIILSENEPPAAQVGHALVELTQDAANLLGYHVYMAGPKPYVSATVTLLRGQGLSPSQLRIETV